jgi:hypothetical protein
MSKIITEDHWSGNKYERRVSDFVESSIEKHIYGESDCSRAKVRSEMTLAAFGKLVGILADKHILSLHEINKICGGNGKTLIREDLQED